MSIRMSYNSMYFAVRIHTETIPKIMYLNYAGSKSFLLFLHILEFLI